jgi:hypothetical protein
MPRCTLCNKETPKDEMIGTLCQECSYLKVQEDDYDIGMDDFS